MINRTTLIFSTMMMASINLASSKLNDGDYWVGALSADSLSKVQTNEKEVLKAYFDQSVKNVETLFATFKAFVDKNGSEEDKKYAGEEDAELKKEVKAFNDEFKEGRASWTLEQYYSFFSECENRVPKLYSHVANVKNVANELQKVSDKEELKHEYEICNVQGKIMFQYPFLTELVKLASDRYDESDYVSRTNQGLEDLNELKKKAAEVTKKNDEIKAVKTFNEASATKVLENYKEFETLARECKLLCLDLYKLARKQLSVLSKNTSMTFFERNVSGFPRGSNALLNIISSRILLITFAIFAIANL